MIDALTRNQTTELVGSLAAVLGRMGTIDRVPSS
jgi:hypothetical protein